MRCARTGACRNCCLSGGCSVRILPARAIHTWTARDVRLRMISAPGADKPSIASAGFGICSSGAAAAIRETAGEFMITYSSAGTSPETAMMSDMERRKCLALLVGLVAWRLASRVQQAQRVRRIGVLVYGGKGSPGSQVQDAAYLPD